MRSPLSLKSRALQLLAQRDQSRVELKRKLLRHARKSAVSASAAASGDVDADVNPGDAEANVEALLDWLEAGRFLSQDRFIESRVHAREGRFGNRRIKSELAQHGLAPTAEIERSLGDSELARAAAVRERRFAAGPADAAERAAQSRFLAGRGFSSDVIHRLMRSLRDAPSADADGVAALP